MNIKSFNPIINNIHNQNTVNKRGKYNNLSPLTKDTVSFGVSASTRKLVEDLKKMSPTGIPYLKYSDVEKVYEYFGHKKSEEGHTKFTGPYGQYANFKKQSPVDPNTAKDLIRSLKHVDEFQGELIIFDHEPTSDEIAEWQERIGIRTPYDGYVNQYAVDNKEKLQALSAPIEEDIVVDSSKEQDKNINELKGRVSIALTYLSQSQEDFGALVEEYKEIKEQAKENKIEFPQEILQCIDEKINAKTESLSIAKANLESYKEKLSKNNMLSDEEIENVNSYQNSENDFSEIEDELIKLEDNFTLQSETQAQLTENIISAISKFDSNNAIIQEQLASIRSLIDEASNFFHMKPGVVDKLNELYDTIEKKLTKINNKINEYRCVAENKTSISRLNKILDKVTAINNNGLATSIPELVEINSLLAKEVTPILSYTEEERAARGAEQVEKFNRRASYAQTPVYKQPKADKQNVIKKEQVQPVATPKQEPKISTEQKIEVPPTDTTLTNTFDPPLAKHITINTNLAERRTQQLKSKLTEKIMPIPLPSVKAAVASLVDENFNVLAFNEVQNGSSSVQEFAKSLAADVVKTMEFNRVKHSARFSFLNGVYESSTNKPEEILGLNGKETRELFNAIQEGKKEIEISSIKISLAKDINMSEIDETFNRYNTRLDSIDDKKGEKIADEILKYMPVLSNEKLAMALLQLSSDGAYYELLLNEDCPQKLRITLLETFWKKYDSDNGTNYASKVIENYESEQQKLKAEEMQKRKLESIKKMDWSL